MTEEHSKPASLVGPIRYDLHIRIPADGENADSIDFAVNALTLPRVGDQLSFECTDGYLMVEVTHVSHYFFSAAEKPPRRTITVTAHPLPNFDELARRLRKSPELDRWISQFTMLDAAT
ncbi:hypothetical protein [Nocardia fluminea]|uniref:Uncharacterized protein n=1 Tax=Nocardia fluminea TaxID=134984 RepID=A0A2N3V581_9NOCA|nr:hypothetical protein [Nocardia fluminea]PKV76751.1 hypothetical protein ATK86_7153 [Nocardia fluminea]